MRFIAHVCLRPNDGDKKPFTVETEFEQDNWHGAWQHCMGLGVKFDAVVMSHRLTAKDEDTSKTTAYLPPPKPKVEEPEVPTWATEVKIQPVVALPWPTTLTC